MAQFLPTHYLAVEEMNELFTHCKNKKRILTKNNSLDISYYSCCEIKVKRVSVIATTEFRGTIAHYITYLDGREDPIVINGGQAYNSLKRAYPELHEMTEDELAKLDFSAGPMIGYSEKWNNQRVEAWGYDLNSAYASAMLKGWIDTTQPPVAKIIDPDTEIGFTCDLEIQRTGFCLFTFKKMPTPPAIIEWVNKYYQKKKEAQTKEEKLKAKQTLNFAVGMLQRKNPWLRAWIVASCNEYISGLLDENSLFWNTDSIVSRTPRPDLELGTEIGQWKLEHEGVVAYRGNSYQWNDDKPTYRGVPKSWFAGDFDLLVDEKPKNENIYYFDYKEVRIYGKDTSRL